VSVTSTIRVWEKAVTAICRAEIVGLRPPEPIPRAHIDKAAEMAGVRAEAIDAQVASLLAHFGWDITVGAGK